jgi:hypothetical protein
MPLKPGISVFSAHGDWLGLVVVMILTGGCSGSHLDTRLDTHRNTHRNTHKGAYGNNIKLDSSHRQPILRFLSLAGSGCRMDQVQLWLQSGKAKLDLAGFGIRLDWV